MRGCCLEILPPPARAGKIVHAQTETRDIAILLKDILVNTQATLAGGKIQVENSVESNRIIDSRFELRRTVVVREK